MRLFTAALPPTAVADHLAAALADVPGMTYRVPREAWHITLGYYGKDDPAGRIPWVRDRVPGLRPPTVALGDMGNFGDTLLMLVSTDDTALADLAGRLRWNDKHPDFNPHLTIGKGVLTPLGYHGPSWTVDEIVLLGAEQRHDYTVLDRVPLKTD
jgi:RNA 2',3'-cyclic 3'-phosphodiesterase